MYIDNKYTKWYNMIISNAQKQCRKKVKRSDSSFVYYESHHIIPKSMGGVEEVLLTAKEHYICHLLLPKMLTGSNKHKMINALIKITFSKSNKQDRYHAKSYNVVRSLVAEKNSEKFKGVPKSEEVRFNMKGRSGVWRRTEESKKNSSTAQKKRFEHTPGTFNGKHHKKESMDKRTITRRERGIKPSFTGKGCKHYTNGTINKFCLPGTQPEGFWPGRVMKGTNDARTKK